MRATEKSSEEDEEPPLSLLVLSGRSSITAWSRGFCVDLSAAPVVRAELSAILFETADVAQVGSSPQRFLGRIFIYGDMESNEDASFHAWSVGV